MNTEKVIESKERRVSQGFTAPVEYQKLWNVDQLMA